MELAQKVADNARQGQAAVIATSLKIGTLAAKEIGARLVVSNSRGPGLFHGGINTLVRRLLMLTSSSPLFFTGIFLNPR
jgi:hypothetical protein